MKLCLCDLDGVIADNTERMARAEAARQAYIERSVAFYEEMFKDSEQSFNPSALNQLANDLYWQTAFDPELVSLDTLIIGADHAIARLSGKVQKIIFLTSRPESMRGATEAWFAREHLSLVFREVVMKEQAFTDGRVFTKVWKVGMVQTLIHLYGADEVIVVEDTQEIIDELQKYVGIPCYHSLQAAVEAMG